MSDAHASSKTLRHHGQDRPELAPHMQAVADASLRTLGADRSSCYVLDDAGVITSVYTAGADSSQREYIDRALGRRSSSTPSVDGVVVDGQELRAIPDASADESSLGRATLKLGSGALLAGPLRDPVSGTTVGALFLGFTDPRSFDADDEHRARGIMKLAGAAIGSARAHTALSTESRRVARLAREQAALLRVAELAASGADPSDLTDRVTHEILKVLGASEVSVVRFDEFGGGELIGGWPRSATRTGAPVKLDGVLRETLQLRRPAISEPTPGVSSTRAAAPVFLDDDLWGALVIEGPEEKIVDAAEVALLPFAKLFGLAYGDADMRAKLAQRASCDPLTGLANHRAFRDRLTESTVAAEVRSEPLSLAIIDIDNFKTINDTWGHGVGDRVLVELSRVLAANVRSREFIARYGGEEFAWLLTGEDRVAAAIAADRMRRAIAETHFTEVGRITVSIGIADLEQASSASRLFDYADRALYWVKNNGRDGTFAYSPDVLGDSRRRQKRPETAAARDLLFSFARAIDARDPVIGSHSERVAELAVAIAGELGWDQAAVLRMREAARMHDVGKVCVPEDILHKADPLTPQETAVVRAHAIRGAEMVTDVLDADQISWVRGHHEQWDGSGYPDALSADDIPDGARIIALADAWDTMTSERVYAPARTAEEALAECRRCSGSHFWPEAVRALAGIASAATPAGADEDRRLPAPS